MNYSVLMSVYYKEKPDYLRIAMNSIFHQTVPTNDFVLVCDGPLTDELNVVINEVKAGHQELNVIRLDNNQGLGKALNHGIHYCKNELVARMDSDDISREDRCEKQLAVFEKFPEVSICSGIVEEFSSTKETIDARRILPEMQEEILSFAKIRNPFNHPCVMYRKKAVEEAGGYQDFYLLEDYYLWIRMLRQEMIGYNIQEPLLWMRAGSEMYKRRSGWKYAKSQIRLFRYMKEIGFIKEGQYFTSICIRVISSVIPNYIRKQSYNVFLRRDS